MRGMHYEFLPPYSPDFNPIKEAFSAIKAHLWQHGNLVQVAMAESNNADVYVHLHKAVWSVTSEDAAGWFRDCGY